MYVSKLNLHNNPNIGLYGFATDSYCILPLNIPKEVTDKIKEVLKVPIHKLKIYNSDLMGVFITGNENLLLIPNIVEESELKKLEKLGLKYEVIKTKFTALGNNIVIKDDICLVNPDLEVTAIEQLEKHFTVKKMSIADTETIGSCVVLNKNGCLIHRDASEAEIKEISKALGLKTDIGTVNFGSPYLRAGLIVNSNGYIMGKDTTGVESQRIDETLGFLK